MEATNVSLRRASNKTALSLRFNLRDHSLSNTRLISDINYVSSSPDNKPSAFLLVKRLSSSDLSDVGEALTQIHCSLAEQTKLTSEDLDKYDVISHFSRLLSSDNEYILNHTLWCIINYRLSSSYSFYMSVFSYII